MNPASHFPRWWFGCGTWICGGMLLIGLLLGACPHAFAQSEPESSQNVVRVTDPHGQRSWDIYKGAEATFKLSNNREVYGHVERVTDSALVISGRAYPLDTIASLKVKSTKQYHEGWIMMGIGGGFWLVAIIGYYVLIIGYIGSSLAGLVAGICMIIGGLALGPLFYILGGIAMAAATVRYVRANGWRMRVVKRAPGKPRETVRKVDP